MDSSNCVPPFPGQFDLGVCSSHGSCVNITANSFACLCDENWNGWSDMFDQSIDNQYSFTCNNSMIGVYIVYSIVLAIYMLRMIRTILWFSKRLPKDEHIKRRGFLRRIMSHDAYRVFFIDLTVMCPGIIAFAALKLADPRNIVGSRVAVTILLMFGTFIPAALVGLIDRSTLTMFVSAASMRWKDETHETVQKQRRQQRMSIVLSFVLFTPIFISLGLARGIGPMQSGQYLCLLARNLGLVVFVLVMLFELQQVVQAQDALMEKLEGSSSLNSLLLHIRLINRTNQKRMVIMGVFYSTFAIPCFWPFQTFLTAFFLIILGTSSYPFEAAEKAKAKDGAGSPKRSVKHIESGGGNTSVVAVIGSGTEMPTSSSSSFKM